MYFVVHHLQVVFPDNHAIGPVDLLDLEHEGLDGAAVAGADGLLDDGRPAAGHPDAQLDGALLALLLAGQP